MTVRTLHAGAHNFIYARTAIRGLHTSGQYVIGHTHTLAHTCKYMTIVAVSVVARARETLEM